MTNGRIAKVWAQFHEKLLVGAGPVQIQEMRRAFYAGAEIMLNTILRGLSPGTEAEDTDLKMMDELHQELVEFVEDIKNGRA